jgi:precorrin-3B C17-methyltransferase
LLRYARNDGIHRKNSPRAQLSIIGIGPGDISHLSQKALDALRGCQLVIGYKTYIQLLADVIDKKKVVTSGMTEEVARVNQAIEEAAAGKKVCLISSGDPGIYGMAGLALELNEKRKEKVRVEIIPGITAASSCAATLGAPLMHDFAVISLSDLLTDKKLISKRVMLAAKGDFVIVFYNPQSKKRTEPLKNAWHILMKHRSPGTPVGIVSNACRDNEEVVITELKNLLSCKRIDMRTTIIVGNSGTYVKGNYMITPRGYVIDGNN